MAAPDVSTKVVVVGAGPAGVRAAEALVLSGVRPVVIDEGMRDGGQIYRRQPEGFTRPYEALYGSEAAKARRVHETFSAMREAIDYRPGTLAWNVTRGALHTMCGMDAKTVPWDALIVCSGATDRLFPVQGWNLAGCYSLGAAQIALKAQACAIGSRVIFAGSGPLLYLVAAQYVKAGAQVAAVLDTSPPVPFRHAWAMLRTRFDTALTGAGLMRLLRRARVRIEHGIVPIAIDGDRTDGVRGFSFRDRAGSQHRIDCDAIGMGWHLRAESQLADLAGAEFAFDPDSRQWLPRLDADGRCSVPRVYLAGDGARILGADGAEAAGRLAALAALADAHHAAGRARYEAERDGLRSTLATMDAFRRTLTQAFPWPHAHAATLPDEAVVCRCEAVTAGELRRTVNDMDAREVNRAKAFSRVGMGRCQGRYCGHASAEIVAQAAGVPVEAVGRLRGQAPVKPLSFASPEAPE